MYSEEYRRRLRELMDTRAWPKRSLIKRCADLGHYGISHGLNGLGGWSREELQYAILRSEFPAEASHG